MDRFLSKITMMHISMMKMMVLLISGIIIFIIAFYTYEDIKNYIFRKIIVNRDWIVEQLDYMFIQVNPKHVVMGLVSITYGLGSLFFLILLPHYIIGSFFFVFIVWVGFKIPKLIIGILTTQRLNKFNEQLVDGLTLMANSLRAGLSLPQSIQILVEELPNPISQEYKLVMSQYQVGVTFEDALQSVTKRIHSEDLEMFVNSIVILRETGGNLAETFDVIIHTIRERMRVESKIKTLTAQGVAQGVIITCMPIGIGGIMYLFDPEAMKPMFTTIPGIMCLILMLMMQGAGGYAIKKIITIKV